MKAIRKYGLIGFPLSHSFSENYFGQKFVKEKIANCIYKTYPLPDISDLWNVLPKDIAGFNVTIPYKEKIILYLDHVEKEARQIGAVNTVHKEGNKWIGYNTDAYGFETSLKALIGKKEVKQAMILGNGGAAKAVKYVLKKRGIKIHIISRKRGYRGYKNLTTSFCGDNRLIVNTTPLGMAPLQNDAPPIPYDGISKKHLLFDLIYNPKKTLFLKRGEQNGASIKNGLEMLHLQAEKSWEIWNSYTNK